VRVVPSLAVKNHSCAVCTVAMDPSFAIGGTPRKRYSKVLPVLALRTFLLRAGISRSCDRSPLLRPLERRKLYRRLGSLCILLFGFCLTRHAVVP